MAEPTLEELQQQIRDLQKLVKPTHTPFDGPEYSFPVVGQGVNSEQFQLISRAAGTGVYVQHSPEGAQSPYRLVGMPGGDSETNAKNQMILKTSSVTGRSEASIEGFFHIQQEDKIIDLPAVSSPTTYHVTVTLDPERETDTLGPVRIDTFPATPPTSRRRKHIVLYTVYREPNQLLTDARVTQTRPWLGHVINVWSYNMLPNPELIEYGTLACVVIPSSERDTGPELYTNRGVHGWVPVYKETKYAPSRLMNDWSNYTGGGGYSNVQFTLMNNVVHLSGMMSSGFWGTSRDIMQLRNDVIPASTKIVTATHGHGGTIQLEIKRDGYMRVRNLNGNSSSWVSLDGITYTLD